MDEETKRQALLAAQGMKDALKVDSLPAQDASMDDVERGPTTLPGEVPGYGRNYNPIRPSPAPEPSHQPSHPGPEPGG